MIWNKPLDFMQIEDANRFRIGDKVKINETSQKDWIGEWTRTEGTILGVTINRRGEADYTLLHDTDQVTDGFEARDLVLISRGSHV